MSPEGTRCAALIQMGIWTHVGIRRRHSPSLRPWRCCNVLVGTHADGLSLADSMLLLGRWPRIQASSGTRPRSSCHRIRASTPLGWNRANGPLQLQQRRTAEMVVAVGVVVMVELLGETTVVAEVAECWVVVVAVVAAMQTPPRPDGVSSLRRHLRNRRTPTARPSHGLQSGWCLRDRMEIHQPLSGCCTQLSSKQVAGRCARSVL